MSRWVYHGTHEGEFMGIPATGTRVTFTGISIDRVAEGKIVESVVELDMLDVLRQLGATVSLRQDAHQQMDRRTANSV